MHRFAKRLSAKRCIISWLSGVDASKLHRRVERIYLGAWLDYSTMSLFRRSRLLVAYNHYRDRALRFALSALTSHVKVSKPHTPNPKI